MLRRLEEFEKRYEDIEKVLSNPSISPSEIHRYSKQRSEISELIETYREYKSTLEEIEKNRVLLGDKEVGELAREEISSLEKKQVVLEEKLRFLLLPKDPNDNKNVFLEIRAGTGGDEAALFAADLFRMYTRYAERNGWKVELRDMNETGIGGFKEVIVEIQGKNVWSKLKYEGGVHRVQRVPTTEAGGRVHTSTATVAVLAEPDDVEVTVDEKDLRIDTFRASGKGGQHVNKTDSAVRITHLPTGIVASCQNERSQHQNRLIAMKVLRARLYEIEEKKRQSEISNMRRSMVGSGDRSEKIRTYNFSQNRITDHRIGLTLYRLDAILDGDIEELIQALITYYQTENLKQAVGS
ncbi:MAG: peptide chain release factor 1 [Candidatus Dadabacteria bacterium RBG_19FT_COMBO_40_33]|nr:MAG: peptide chain release factor 1 [Candidatus Dadabacteria bacterium RBG_19FT_COMBO_40_33]